MPSDLPMLGEAPKKSPLLAIALSALAVGALAGGLFLWRGHSAVTLAAAEPPAAPAPVGGTPTPAAPQPAPELAGPRPDDRALKSFDATINGPFEQAVVKAVGKD